MARKIMKRKEGMKLSSTGLAHIGLRVTNLARARQFYVDTLGFEPLLELPDPLICNAYGSTIAFRGNATQTHAVIVLIPTASALIMSPWVWLLLMCLRI